MNEQSWLFFSLFLIELHLSLVTLTIIFSVRQKAILISSIKIVRYLNRRMEIDQFNNQITWRLGMSWRVFFYVSQPQKFFKLNSFLVHSFECLFVTTKLITLSLVYVSSTWSKTWILRFIKEQEFISAYTFWRENRQTSVHRKRSELWDNNARSELVSANHWCASLSLTIYRLVFNYSFI